MIYHILAFAIGFIIDLIVGDPYFLPHPIRWIGSYIAMMDIKLNIGDEGTKRRNGLLMGLLVSLSVAAAAWGILFLAYGLHPIAGLLIESIMTYQILALKCLKVESMKVYDKLKNGTIEEARKAVSMIVGRDTNELTQEQVAKAAVETVAENTSDGVIAPMIYLALGGPALGFFYKAVNTMDSMVGYKNDKYMDFGRFPAKLDDVMNYIPARISAIFMVAASFPNTKNAFRIFKRDRYNHSSPNSAQTEAVMAGALGVQLAGDASYFGKLVKKPFIGDKDREIEAEDIKRANALMYKTAFLCMAVCLIIKLLIYLI